MQHEITPSVSEAKVGTLDEVDVTLLDLLQGSGRMSMAELARRVGMSPPGVAERLRRLENSGVIRGYAARIDPTQVGYTLGAFVRLTPSSSTSSRATLDQVLTQREIVEAHHVVGEDCWILKVVVRDTEHLEELLLALSAIGRTTTSIILSSPVPGRPLLLPALLAQDAPLVERT
jgi:Lrp/AsnC family transcriptional regulator, leucine-responsive regulatory protein